MTIGNNIKQLRQRKNMTQEDVAKKLGVSSQAVSKWENNANTPDIMLLPAIAELFSIPIDALFADNIDIYSNIQSFLKDDDVFRVIQMRGTRIVNVSSTLSPDEPPIEIAFPHDCNDRTQYFKVEVYGHMIVDGSVNGDVVCHQSIQCGAINGDVKCEGNVKVNELNCQKVICNHITECYKLRAGTIECRGNIHSVTLTCDQYSVSKENPES